MKRYAAFLRAVSPMNAKMPELKRAFETAGFTDVKTVLSSGNVVFSAPAAWDAMLERKAEAAMEEHLGHAFLTIVHPLDALRRMLASDPYKPFRLKPGSKRVVTFLRGKPKARLALPIELHGSRILRRRGGEVFSVYVPGPTRTGVHDAHRENLRQERHNAHVGYGREGREVKTLGVPG